jgi:hypothetical protein
VYHTTDSPTCGTHTENGWVLTIMTRLLNSPDPQLRKALEAWSDTPLMELGFAITTRMHILGLCIQSFPLPVAQAQ